jgi:glutaredoxin
MRRDHRQTGRHRRHGSAWRTAAALIGLALLVAAGAAAAQSQIYKWKDAKGEVHYGDTPPPQGAQTMQMAGQPPAPAAGSSMPYELTRAVLQHPVTLYTTARCDACDQGRSLLRARGIPFTEKTVNTQDDQQAQRRETGKDELPLLLVGTRQVVGFQAAGWQEALDSASYPRRSVLPSGYRFDPPEPAAPVTAANAPGGPVRSKLKPPPDAASAQAQAAQPRSEAHTEARPKPAGNAPPDFQF